MKVYPNYYKDFKCIADKCKHSCCIGWEIDIDEDTLDFYENLGGELGGEIRENISYDGDVHFCLKEGERCPFLNEQNLCRLILALGEDSLCRICSDHPRFRNEIGLREEIGLGLCCEAAAELILSQEESFELVLDGEPDNDDEILKLRDSIIKLVDNSDDLEGAIDMSYVLLDSDKPNIYIKEWLCILKGLEILDPCWEDWLDCVNENYSIDAKEKFDEYILGKGKMYSKLFIYFIYRYFALASDTLAAVAKLNFAYACYKLIYAMSAVTYAIEKSFDISELCELCRRFSSEIEYSTDNLDICMENCYDM